MIENAKQMFTMISCFCVLLFLNKKIVTNEVIDENTTTSIKKRLSLMKKSFKIVSSEKTGRNQINVPIPLAKRSQSVCILCIINLFFIQVLGIAETVA
jgi:hypothetical protein